MVDIIYDFVFGSDFIDTLQTLGLNNYLSGYIP